MGQLISKSDESMKEHAPWVDKAAQYVPAGLITYETVQVIFLLPSERVWRTKNSRQR